MHYLIRAAMPVLAVPFVSTIGPAFASDDSATPTITRTEQQPQTEVSAGETVYQWTDEQGVTHYGAQPPEGVAAEKVDLSSRLSTVETTEVRPGEEEELGE